MGRCFEKDGIFFYDINKEINCTNKFAVMWGLGDSPASGLNQSPLTTWSILCCPLTKLSTLWSSSSMTQYSALPNYRFNTLIFLSTYSRLCSFKSSIRYIKNPLYGRHWISRRVPIVAPMIIMCQVSCVRCNVSYVMCHISRITCHSLLVTYRVSPVKCH